MKIRAPVASFFLAVAMAVLLVFALPGVAHADGLWDSFSAGFDTLVNPQVDSVEQVEQEQEGLGIERLFASAAGDAVVVDTSGFSEVVSVAGRVNRVPWLRNDGVVSYQSWLSSIRYLLGDTTSGTRWSRELGAAIILPVSGLVFFWFGLRKSASVVRRAWKGGRLNV